jgi:hypothetical protein
MVGYVEVKKMEELIKKKMKEWIVECLLSSRVEYSWLLKVLPFEKERVRYDSSSCKGLTYNRGLLTQCLNKKKEEDDYCKGCMVSLIGTVEERLEVGLYSYVDRKGHKVKEYSEVLKKINRSVEEAKLEGYRIGKKISSEHLKEKVVKLSRGRPKKEKKLKCEKKDLFARVYLDECECNSECDSECDSKCDSEKNEKKVNVNEKKGLTKEERLSRKCEIELKREEKMNARLIKY